MAGLKDSNKETTSVMDDEEMLSNISRTCQVLTLTPSCVITSLGHLLLTSAGQDFSLKEHCDDKQFKHPDSFRACLVQVCNDVCDTFDAAHRSMNRICVKSEHIAMNAKSALKVMGRDTPKEMSIALDYLQDAEESCLKCVETAASLAEEFENVAKTINDLFVDCIRMEGKYRNEQNSISHRIEVVNEEKEQIEESEKNLDESWDKAKKEYNDAAAACPSPWKTFLLKFIDSVAHLAINLGVESLKQRVMPQTQVTIPNLETDGGPFTKAFKNMPEEKERERKQEYDGCISRRKEAGQKLQESKENASKNLEKFHHELNEIKKIKDALKESMKDLVKVQKSWRLLKIMFQDFHDLIRDRLEESVKEALKECKNAEETAKITPEKMIQESRRALSVACVVEHISRFYVDVSNKYLLVGVNDLQSIALLERSRDREKMDEVWRKLKEDAKKAEKEIPIITEEKKNKLSKELSQHQLDFEND